MKYLNESELTAFGRSDKSYVMTLSESLRSFKGESKYNKTTVFLSHKHDERKELEGAISFLKKHGVDVYVDWLDDGMPKQTSGITAVRIKQKIKENKKFILLATEGAISSKWCNWELGLGDAEKYMNNIAILPIKRTYSEFSGSEYLQIYPYIIQTEPGEWYRGDFRYKGAYVVFPNKEGNESIMSLEYWLKR